MNFICWDCEELHKIADDADVKREWGIPLCTVCESHMAIAPQSMSELVYIKDDDVYEDGAIYICSKWYWDRENCINDQGEYHPWLDAMGFDEISESCFTYEKGTLDEAVALLKNGGATEVD